MKQNKISITHVGNTHSDWIRALDFYKQELGILKKRLTEIASKNTGADTMKEVEHYENQFKVQSDNIDRLHHDIRDNASRAAEEASASKAHYIDAALATEHNDLQEQYSREEKNINELRQGFNRFAATWM